MARPKRCIDVHHTHYDYVALEIYGILYKVITVYGMTLSVCILENQPRFPQLYILSFKKT